MSSSSTRAYIVTRALTLAGRGVELQSEANAWLNDMLKDWALDFKFPSLRKVLVPSTLNMGSQNAPLPADFGAGFDKQGILFGVENLPMSEKTYEEFAFLKGFPQSGTTTGRPQFFMVDRNGGNIIFNSTADQAYPFQQTYFQLPASMPTDSSGDLLHPWPDNDNITIQGLIERIYQYTGDPRELQQWQKVYGPGGDEREGMFTKWKRELFTMGGTSRVMPSPERFKFVRF